MQLIVWTCNHFSSSVFKPITNIAMISYISIPSSQSNANVTSTHQCIFLSEGYPSCFSANKSQISEKTKTKLKASHSNNSASGWFIEPMQAFGCLITTNQDSYHLIYQQPSILIGRETDHPENLSFLTLSFFFLPFSTFQ